MQGQACAQNRARSAAGLHATRLSRASAAAATTAAWESSSAFLSSSTAPSSRMACCLTCCQVTCTRQQLHLNFTVGTAHAYMLVYPQRMPTFICSSQRSAATLWQTTQPASATSIAVREPMGPAKLSLHTYSQYSLGTISFGHCHVGIVN